MPSPSFIPQQAGGGSSGGGRPTHNNLLFMEADGTGGSTVYQDGAGTVPVTANGQTIDSWKDPISGALPSYSGSPSGMIYQASGINGLPSVAMAGSGNGLYTNIQTPSFPSLQANQVTAWIVCETATTTPPLSLFFGIWNTTGWIFETDNLSSGRFNSQINSGLHDMGPALSTQTCLCLQVDGVGGTFAAYQDGVLIASGSSSTFATLTTGNLCIGALAGLGYPFSGLISACMIQGGLFTPIDSSTGQAMQAYCQAKYGTP